MTKIYTKNGDEGETNLFLGGKLSKNDVRVEAFGTVDELVSSLGFAKTLCENPKVIETLEMLQHSLFKIEAELSSDSEKTVDIINVITKDNVNEIEKLIDSITESVDLGNEFIMPGTSSSSAAIDISRTIARRLERVVVSINNDNKINKFILVYLNRISDLLFVLGRLEDEGKKNKKNQRYKKKVVTNETLTLGIINHRYANIHSVKKALKYVDCNYIELNDPSEFNKVSAIILPGVGAFDAAMQVLNNTGMSDALLEANNRKTPIFGICLGMQLLFNRSEEGNEDGLGLIDGEVKKIKQINDLKIPHMGWNESYFPKKTSNFKNIKNKSFFYYVHSYECVPSNENVITSYTYYGNKICSSIEYKNIFATQFHPEKSGNDGIKIYKNFIRNLI